MYHLPLQAEDDHHSQHRNSTRHLRQVYLVNGQGFKTLQIILDVGRL